MKISRRTALAAAAGVAAPLPAIAQVGGWPHPSVGRVLKPGERPAPEELLAGAVIAHGKIVDPGRVYTRAEWDRVKADVEPYLRRRMAALRP